MSYVDGYVIAVPTRNREAYEKMARKVLPLFKKYGATRMVETWGNDVPEGKLTSFPLAVKAEKDETIVFSWVSWPDKATRDTAWKSIMQDPEMNDDSAKDIFDGKRMIYGGFEVMIDE